METEKNNNYKSYVQLLPYLSGVIILISIIKAIIFYNVFGIRIVAYLDLSECVLIFLDQLLVIAIAIVISFAVSNILVAKNLNFKLFEFLNSKDQKSAHFKENNKKYLIILIPCGCLFFISSLVFQPSYLPTRETIVISIAFVFFYIFPPFLLFIFSSTILSYSYKNILVTGFTIIYLGSLIYIGLHEAYQIKYGEKKQVVNLTFKTNESINTSDTLVYIGTTRNYYFFFNPNTMKKTIFMKSELTKLSIQ